MAISVDRVQTGAAERLDINRADTGLQRHGLSASGRAVEWLRHAVPGADGVALSKPQDAVLGRVSGLPAAGCKSAKDRVGMDENQQVMHAFVGALKAEHGDRIGGKAATVLQGHESKPLSSRRAQQVIGGADNTMRARVTEGEKDEAAAPPQFFGDLPLHPDQLV
jgi:hypothetical protein